jgi:ribosomal protein L16/L10AE
MTQKSVDASEPKVACKVLEEGIIENIVLERANLEVEDVKKVKEQNLKLVNDMPYCVLLTTGQRGTASKEARQLAASRAFANKTVAKAIVVENVWTKILANLYVRVNQPMTETRVFDTRNEAIRWLREMYRNHKLKKIS